MAHEARDRPRQELVEERPHPAVDPRLADVQPIDEAEVPVDVHLRQALGRRAEERLAQPIDQRHLRLEERDVVGAPPPLRLQRDQLAARVALGLQPVAVHQPRLVVVGARGDRRFEGARHRRL